MTNLVGIEKGLQVPKEAVGRAAASAAVRSLEVIDPSTIECLEYRVLLKVLGVDDMTEGGIFKPESFFEKELFNKTHAVFVNSGPEAFTDSTGEYIGKKPEFGDLVITTKYAGNVYRDEDFNLYRFANDKDIVAIVKEAGNE